MRTAWKSIICAVSAFVAVNASARAGTIIGDAVKIGGGAQPINLLDGGLAEGVLAYTDRTHTLRNIPDALVGADLIQLSNDDKIVEDLEIEVTVLRLSVLYVALDNRHPQPKPWMGDPSMTGLPDIFYDTGVRIGIDESDDGDIDQTFTLWLALAPAGTYRLLANGPVGTYHVNNYLVFGSDTIVVPEPGTLLLSCLGLVGLAASERRRRS